LCGYRRPERKILSTCFEQSDEEAGIAGVKFRRICGKPAAVMFKPTLQGADWRLGASAAVRDANMTANDLLSLEEDLMDAWKSFANLEIVRLRASRETFVLCEVLFS